VDTTIRVERLDGGVLVLDGGGLADAFFADAETSEPTRTAVDRIETRDIEVLNRTMRARTPLVRWVPISDRRLPWLAAIDPELDLIETEDAEWEASDADRLVEAALTTVVGEGRGVAVATKMLYLKRPRLFPMLDRFLVELLAGAISPDAAADVRARQAARLVVHLRGQGRQSLGALRRIQAQLARRSIEHSLVRILDAILWSAHPAAGLSGAPRSFTCGLR
jgi:hypothetical protein